jgi:hypothetical protein
MDSQPEGTVEYLNLDGLNHCLKIGRERGWWEVGRRNLVTATVHRRRNGYFALPVVAHPFGWGVVRRDLPATVIDRAVSDVELGVALQAVLAHPETSVPDPKPSRMPILRQAKASSWRDLVRTSETVEVMRRDVHFVVDVWVRDRTRLDAVQIPGPDGQAHLVRPSPEQLGRAVMRACDAAALWEA